MDRNITRLCLCGSDLFKIYSVDDITFLTCQNCKRPVADKILENDNLICISRSKTTLKEYQNCAT